MTNKLKCVIIDDEDFAIKVIESHLSIVDDFEVVEVFHSGVEAFKSIVNMDIDVIFLDIQMPKISGISMLKMLKNPPAVVLTTAHRDFAIEGFDLNVVDYLLKPIGIERFMQAIDKLRVKVNSLPNTSGEDCEGFTFIKANRKYHKIFYNSILYVEAVKNHIKIVTHDENLISLLPISEFIKTLPKSNFIQTHRSFIVNKKEIKAFSNNSIIIKDFQIPIGRTYKQRVREDLFYLL